MALSAVDLALWDLKASLLDVPLATLLDAVRDEVPIYGSGGFMTYDPATAEQLGGWVEEGIPRVKIKIGRDPDADPERVESARAAIGDEAELYVDANGATREGGARVGRALRVEWGVTWFEEPVVLGRPRGAAARARARPGRASTLPPASTPTSRVDFVN